MHCVQDFCVMVAMTDVSRGVGQVSAELMSAGTPWSPMLGVGDRPEYTQVKGQV